MSKKYVLFANTAFTILNFRSELISKLLSNGNNVTVICPRSCNLTKSVDVGHLFEERCVDFVDIKVTRNGINPFKDVLLLFKLIGVFKKLKPDIVMNYTIKPTIYGSLAAKIAGVPVVSSNITGLGYVFTDNKIKTKLIRLMVGFLYSISLRLNDLVFFQNSDDKLLFKKSHYIGKTSTLVINGSGVNLEQFNPNQFTDLNKKTLSFIFIGRLLIEKGISEFLCAAKKVKNEYPNVDFIVLGAIDNNPGCFSKSLLDQYIKDGIIDYKGEVSDVRSFLARSEVLVLPSYREGTPRAVLEAMAMGLAIITTDSPGCKETVVEGKNGLLVAIKDAESLYEAIVSLVKDKNLRIEMGRESRKMVKEKYDVEIVNEQIINALQGL